MIEIFIWVNLLENLIYYKLKNLLLKIRIEWLIKYGLIVNKF
jgi:hypothetical protein